MSVAMLLSILKFLKKNWKECLCGGIIVGCGIVIIAMGIKLKIHRNQIIKHLERVEYLEHENEFLTLEVKGLEEQISDMKHFDKAFSNASHVTVYELPKDTIKAYITFSNSFFETQVGGTN